MGITRIQAPIFIIFYMGYAVECAAGVLVHPIGELTKLAAYGKR
jgi:hypothetical protein